jgi:hypothetical protein
MIVATTSVLEDGPRNAVIQFTGKLETGDSETDVLKVDVGLLNPDVNGVAPTNVSIQGIMFSTSNVEVQVQWEGSGNPIAFVCPSYFAAKQDFKKFGGLINKTPAATGNILFSTVNMITPSTNSQYNIILWLKKRY